MNASQRGREILTPAWTYTLFAETVPAEVHMVYVTASPENFDHIYGTMSGMLGSAPRYRLLGVRCARDLGALETVNASPHWAGKAITFMLPGRDEASALAADADALLTGHRSGGGPAAWRARPYGGRSGMVFLRAMPSAGDPSQATARLGRLQALLGGAPGEEGTSHG